MSRPAFPNEALTPAGVTLLNLPPLSRLLVRAGLALADWEMRRRTRNALKLLAPHHLRDIGLDQAQRQSECEKPFWQA